MEEKQPYSINLNVKFEPLQLIDIPQLVAATKEQWFNQTLTQVNDAVVRLGILQGEFHWHHHDDEDEFFFVLAGELLIELEDKTIKLGPHQGFTVPRGVRHCTRAPQKTVLLMIEGAGVKPTGN